MLDTGKARKHRSHVVPHAHELVLEIGFGSGTNLPFYGEQVERVLAVDPATLGQQLAADRLAKFAAPVEFIGLDGQVLPRGRFLCRHCRVDVDAVHDSRPGGPRSARLGGC